MDPYDHPRAHAEPATPPDRARRLRQSMTPPEVILWAELRAHRLGGFKFRRQHPMGPFVADFYCDEVQLVVEIDGETHNGRGAEDARRDAWMRERGVSVLRITASEVSKDLNSVLRTIHDRAKRGSESQ